MVCGLWFVKLTMNENIAWIFSGLVSVVRKVWNNLVEKAGEEQQLLEKKLEKWRKRAIKWKWKSSRMDLTER